MKNAILFLAASPATQQKLDLDEEARDIEAMLNAVPHRDAFEFKTKWAVRPDDLQDALLREEPVIVHFSGHGAGAPGIVLHGGSQSGEKLVTADALQHLFRTLKDNIRVVVLNACYAEEQASAIVEEIDFVVGMSDVIGDTAARKFAAAFYRGLGFARSVRTAFDLGVGAIMGEGLQDAHVPVLLSRTGLDAAEVRLVSEERSLP